MLFPFLYATNINFVEIVARMQRSEIWGPAIATQNRLFYFKHRFLRLLLKCFDLRSMFIDFCFLKLFHLGL